MAVKLIRLTNKTAIQLHLVAESCTIFSSRSTQPVRKLLDTPSYYALILGPKNEKMAGNRIMSFITCALLQISLR
jgi:hypothetical protein